MKKKITIIAIIFLLVICLIPIHVTLKDGGTKIYNAVLYKIVILNQLQSDGSKKTGTEFYFFPMNFLN